MMQQQTQKMQNFASVYKKIEKDKKKAGLKALEFILELNQQIGFDEVLLRSAFSSYHKKNELEIKHSQETFNAFFKHVDQNLNEIESNYLKDTNDSKLIQQAESTNKTQYNFLLNKNSVSKFIRDETAHYQKITERYLEKMNQGEDEKGIKQSNISAFLIDLFTSKYVMIIRQGQEYLKRPGSQIKVDVNNHLIQYAKKFKQLAEPQNKLDHFISEEEILDFLTFWLREQPTIFILYARTQERLAQESKLILNQSHLTHIVHPSRMTTVQIIKKSEDILRDQQEQHENQQTFLQNQKITSSEVQKLQESIVQNKTFPIKIESREKTRGQSKLKETVPEEQKKEYPKEEMVKRQMKYLFEFGCKRKYKTNKNTTFQDISEQSKTMNLQKFVYFCQFFELTSFFSRDVIVQYFKTFSIHHRILDYSGFQQIIEKMMLIDDKICENLLKKSTFQLKLKRNQMNKDRRLGGKLSSYKFILHPINGKDVTTIQKELNFRKLEKIIVREEKQKLALKKREQVQKAPSKMASRIMPSFSASKVSAVQLETIRDTSFNPQKLISQGDSDKLWEAYEAKIWKKDQKSYSTLQSILTKRIERGNIIINKLNSQRSFIYDQ